uniref:Uncharacterized protein n=1 Tax=Brassica oleracea var. oleracea TaxID=109376 RepID=A0A0D3BE60_BRAOL
MAAQQAGYEAQRRLNQQMMEMMQRMYPNEELNPRNIPRDIFLGIYRGTPLYRGTCSSEYSEGPCSSEFSEGHVPRKIPRNISSELPRIGPSESPSKYPDEVLPRYIPRSFPTNWWSSKFSRKFVSSEFRQKIPRDFFPCGIGAPAGVLAPRFEPWPLRNLHVGCSTRDRIPLHGEPHGDALAASMLTSVSSLDHFGGARILG